MHCYKCKVPLSRVQGGWQCPQCPFFVPNSWVRWHPKNYIFQSIEDLMNKLENGQISEEAFNIEKCRTRESFLEMFPGPYKSYNDPTTMKGDIIEDYVRSLRVKLNKYQCPHCKASFSNWDNAQDHANSHLRPTPEHPSMKPSDMIETEYAETLPAANVYYEVVRPEVIIPHVRSIEWGPKTYIASQKFKIPMPADREKHEHDMAKWREQMEQTRGQRTLHLEIQPSGELYEKGASGKWWYWCPQVWEPNYERWVPIPTQDLAKITECKQKFRVLFLLAIIPADLQIAVPSTEIEVSSKEEISNEDKQEWDPIAEEYK